MTAVKGKNLRMDLSSRVHAALKKSAGKTSNKKAVAKSILLQGLVDKGLYVPTAADRKNYGVE